jgi:F0F1-type ATP synthase assembly protein I
MAFRRMGRKAGESLRAVGALSTVGLAFVLAIVIGAWLGSVLDRWFGTKPVLFIVFFFFGLAAGILNVYRTVSSALGTTRPGVPPGSGPGAGTGTDNGPTGP